MEITEEFKSERKKRQARIFALQRKILNNSKLWEKFLREWDDLVKHKKSSGMPLEQAWRSASAELRDKYLGEEEEDES